MKSLEQNIADNNETVRSLARSLTASKRNKILGVPFQGHNTLGRVEVITAEADVKVTQDRDFPELVQVEVSQGENRLCRFHLSHGQAFEFARVVQVMAQAALIEGQKNG